jgi:hypothetical protein
MKQNFSQPNGSTVRWLGSMMLPSVRLVAALVAAGAVAVAGHQAVSLGYDWGYYLVEKLFGKSQDAVQGLEAIYSLAFCIAPLFFGCAFGCLREAWSGSVRWNIAAVVSNIVCLFLMLGPPQALDESNLEEFVWLAFAVPSVLGGLWIGRRIYSTLRTRVKIHPVLAGTSVGLMILAIAGGWSTEAGHPWDLEMLIYGGIVTLVGASAAVCARARDKTAGVILAMIAVLPILLANLLNVSANIICLGLNAFGWGPDLGWRALLSATLISTVALASCVLGGSLGFWFRKRFVPM